MINNVNDTNQRYAVTIYFIDEIKIQNYGCEYTKEIYGGYLK